VAMRVDPSSAGIQDVRSGRSPATW
jgi:hypothetical protein